MPYEVSWEVEQRVIYLRFYGRISHQDIETVSKACSDYIRQGQQPVHIYIDTLKVSHYPHDIRWLTSIRNNDAQNKGWNLMLVKSPELRYFTDIIFKLTKGNFRAFHSFAEAELFLWEQDHTLKPS